MKRIVTLTFCPAIDKSTTVEKLLPEKKLSCSMPTYEPGGGGINIARAIHQLGGNALAVYPAGGCSGKTFQTLLKEESVPQICIPTKSHTRENLVVVETATARQYRFGMPGPPLSVQELENILSQISQLNNFTYLVVSGSVPHGLPVNLFQRLVEIVAKKEAKLVVDTAGDALKQAVDAGVFLIKPNLKELVALTSKPLKSRNSIIQAAKQLIASGRCELIMVSMGYKGAMLITPDSVQALAAPKVKVKSTVGAGDSMLAGMLFSIANGIPLSDAFLYAVACGTAATLNPGTELCHASDVHDMAQKIKRVQI